MAITQKLGSILSVQKILIFPNFDIFFKKKTTKNLLIFLLRTLFATFLSISCLYNILRVTRRIDFKIESISRVPDTVGVYDRMINKLGIVVLGAVSVFKNRSHLQLIFSADEFESCLEKLMQNPVKVKRRWCIDFQVICIILYNTTVISMFYPIIARFYQTWMDTLQHFMYIVVCSFNDLFIIYLINFIRVFEENVQIIEGILRKESCNKRPEHFVLVHKYLELHNKMNKVLGFYVFLSFVHHLVRACLTTYFVFYVTLDKKNVYLKSLTIPTCSLFALGQVFLVTYLSYSGGTLHGKVRMALITTLLTSELFSN